MNIFTKIGRAVTRVNDIAAGFASLLIYPLILVLVYEVFMRYVLVRPTIYSYDLSWMMYVTFVMLGAGYALGKDAHVKADVFYRRLTGRGKMIINMITFPAFFFVTMGAFLYTAFRQMRDAWIYGEAGFWTPWDYPLWPIRTVIFISVLLLTLQGAVKFAGLMKKPEEGKNHDA